MLDSERRRQLCAVENRSPKAKRCCACWSGDVYLGAMNAPLRRCLTSRKCWVMMRQQRVRTSSRNQKNGVAVACLKPKDRRVRGRGYASAGCGVVDSGH